MTVLLNEYQAPPGVSFLRAWLGPLGGAGARRAQGESLPFTLIQRYDGHEDRVTDVGYYQLDHLAGAASGKSAFTACDEYARLCTRRMTYLRDHPWTEVTVPGWDTITADFVECVEAAHDPGFPYTETGIERLVSRWRVDLRLVPVAP